jgi:hypothetical protein
MRVVIRSSDAAEKQRPRLLVVIMSVMIATATTAASAAPPDFAREVRPVLSNRCFKCHGPDEGNREGGLRLDLHDAATAELDSGARAIVPEHPLDSELVARITSTDPDLVMPPPHTKVVLTDDEKRILTEWIAAGAEYRPHWAFERPTLPEPPAASGLSRADWPRNPIDRFVLARLDREGVPPAREADAATLCRRVHLDLVGLPPSPAELDAFLADPSPEAYEKLVDRLLASPRYGERWARRWLDLARYADTNGYEKDRERSIWPYRDWVISALNDDMPFDRFTIRQIAGDMLPEATAVAGEERGQGRGGGGCGAPAEEGAAAQEHGRVDALHVVWHGGHSFVSVSSRHKSVLATIVQAARSAGASRSASAPAARNLRAAAGSAAK